MEYIVIILYGLSLLLIFLFSLGQLHLTWHYLKAKKQKDVAVKPLQVYPKVTVQLPVYNERYVVQRLIDAVCRFEYPKEKLEIQVLDDSTDETVEIIADKVNTWKAEGVNIRHIRREERTGFKAGALQYGLDMAEGEFIAVFDADFLPQPDFLSKTLPVFENTTGVVQTRWGHLNKDYSILTRLQAFGLDAHFSIEQTGRNHAGSFINFNGTGGVWRKKCIYDAGGWSADTLTEDLDLSYRAQMKGWKFKYLEDYTAPAELPVIMTAVKSQQYRWNKGAAETARKNLGKVFRSPINGVGKLHAFFHLLNSSVFICLLLASVLSIPMLFIKDAYPAFNFIFNLGSIFLIGFLSIGFFYWIASRQSHPKGTGKYYLTTFPVFLTVSMGLSLHNGIAVLEGLLGIKSPFIRTPKFNIKSKADSWKDNIYVKRKIDFLTILEGFLSLYFMFGIAAGIYLNDLGLIIFHVMLTLGFASVFYYSIKPLKHG
ncbi:glycosyltransferase family 2 protein [Fulvivirga ulvae]|uniref:cellulose synthase family protein n=1 Tax=Fulvivirga ulvae TaxID=2904245 RepID=UPI001F377C23|nr:cellulose synthase family protein [Fulvivirga ulvae]UII33303.1 glycosyltransferase family 2 protein [Fulvivirga ulvae]